MAAKLPTVLEDIVRARRTHLPGIHERVRHVRVADLPRSTRSLYDALQGSHRFIMECKSSSPSLGVIREAYEPGAIARIYSRYAQAISVLCEPERFGGDYDHLATVAMSTHLPVLCKDFIIDEVQVRAARYFGADAILLMLSILSDDDYAKLSSLAAELGLDVLTEVIDEDEMARAGRLGARIVGINHRNLHDLTIDLSRSAKLAPLAPEGAVIVAESGIRDNATVRALSGHANAFLVGSQLTGQPDIDAAVRRLIYGDTKVCGLTSAGAAQAARAGGAVYGGLIFEESSPRHVTTDQAARIIGAEPDLAYVAVTRSLDDWDTLLIPGVSALQLHAPLGTIEEERAQIERAREAVVSAAHRRGIEPDVQIWRAVSMSHARGAELATQIAPLVDRIVLDANNGGSGETFDWSTIPTNLPASTLLAGGIGPDNLGQALAVATSHGFGLDLNSGLETAGRKDARAIARAFHTIRHFTPGCTTTNTRAGAHNASPDVGHDTPTDHRDGGEAAHAAPNVGPTNTTPQGARP